MADTEQNPPSSDELLSEGLRRLAGSSPQAASPELERVLVQSFHRRHRRRKTLRFALAMTVCLAIVAGLLGWQLVHRNPIEKFASSQRIGQQSSAGRMQESHLFGDADASTFVALPSFALSVPGEELRILRVEMPVSSLRLLGARVNDELSTQQLVADVLIGTDGTPYAFRIIN